MKFKLLILSLISFTVSAQNTLSYSALESHYNNGIELFERKAYSSARAEFQQYIALSEKSLTPNQFNLANAAYYSAMSSLHSKAMDTDIEIERFVLNHGDHPKARMIFSDLAGNYFERKEYKDAIKYYEKSLENRTDNLDTYEIRYNLGLAYYQEKDFNNALRQFDFVKGTVIENAVNAAYYAAVIHFDRGNYDLALGDFYRVENVPAYKKEVPNWIGQILYRQEKYDQLLAYAEPIISNPDGRKVDDLSLLAAEVSFFKDDFHKAALYYDKFRSLRRTKMPAQMAFRYGFSLYKTDQFDKASSIFKEIAGNKDELGQQAAYYLGICALQAGDLNSAAVAFDNAQKLDYDEAIKEEASFNYIKVMVEQGNNQAAIESLQYYATNYPSGKYYNEVNELLAEILFETNNYDYAINYIESLSSTTSKIDEAYQKLTFNQGVTAFNTEKFDEAINYFDKSLSKSFNNSLRAQAQFWKAEALTHLGDTGADRLYRDLLSSGDKLVRLRSMYSIGYIHFNNENYTEASRYFQDFRTGARGEASLDEKSDDALLRIGDCFLAARNLNQALNTYDDAYRNNKIGKDYALYQKAMVFKYQGKDTEAKNTLDLFARLYKNSRLIPDVMLQNGNIAMESGNYSSAITIYTDLLRNNPSSEIVPEVLLKRAIAFNNIGSYDRAISDFNLILNKYGKTKQANEAFLGIREALSHANRSEEFFEIAENYKRNNPESSSVQGLQFETAKDLFFKEDYDKAVTAFTRFIEQYSGSVLIPEANYLLAESYAALNNLNMALRYYQIIVSGNQIEFLSQAAMRSANIYIDQKKYDDAILNFLQVTFATSNQRELVTAYDGLMKSYYNNGNYSNTTEFANKILETGGNVVLGAGNRAELYKGKVLLKTGDYNSAKAQFGKVINLAKDESAAEAKYRTGEILYLEKDYDGSIKTMQELASDFSDFLIWYERAFLLIADNYVGKDDMFMAKATLNSIIENSETTEILDEARRKLSSLN